MASAVPPTWTSAPPWPSRSAGPPPTAWSAPAARWSWARTRAAPATCSWPRSRPVRPAWAWTSTASGSSRRRPCRTSRAPASSAQGSWSRPRTTRPRTTGSRFSNPAGLKLDDDLEDELEALVLRADELPGVAPAAIGRGVDAAALLERYVAHRTELARRVPAPGIHVVLDTANGAASHVAPAILRATGARVTVIHDAPDGDNINRGCGATAAGVPHGGGQRARGGRRLRA